MRHNLHVLRDRSFRYLFLARTVSLLGNAIAPVALAFAVLDLPGGSATEIGLVLFAYSAARLVFLLWGGVLADRFARYRLMVGSDLLSGLTQACVAALFLTHTASLAPLMVLAAMNGTSSALFIPAATGLTPQVVPAPLLRPANALLSLSTNTASIAGAALAGVLVTTVGPGWALAVDALSFLVSAVLLAGVRVAHTARAEPASMLGDLRHGWREFVSRQWVWVVVAQFAFVNVYFDAGFFVLGPVVADQSLGGASAWSVIAASMSCGLLLGSLMMMRLSPRRPMRAAVLATFGFAPALLLLALGAPVWLIAVAATLTGVCATAFSVLWDTTLQSQVPQQALSRVSSYDALGSFALGPVGYAIVGPVSEAIGVTATLTAAAVLLVLTSVAALLSPSVRRLPAGDTGPAGS